MSRIRKIIHIDMDCFYATIEMRDNPLLQDKPVAVGGSEKQRGVLSTCNYPARRFGLHSAMPTAQALKRCPQLVLLPVNMPLYRQVSQQIQHILRDYTHIIEPLSLDEAYLDVTDCTQCQGSATWIAQDIRRRIWTETRLTASAGVAPLKFLAKVASEQNKPNGMFVIKPEEVTDFISTLPLQKIPGVGAVTSQRLMEMGLKTCADIQRTDLNLLLNTFGKMGKRIWTFSHGIDEREVQAQRERKSIGVETTLCQNIFTVSQGLAVLDQLYPTLVQRTQQACPEIPLSAFHKIGVKLKFDDFQVTTLEKSAVQFRREIFDELLHKIWLRAAGRTVRLIGLHANVPTKRSEEQLSLW